jgi:hypothetical protein
MQNIQKGRLLASRRVMRIFAPFGCITRHVRADAELAGRVVSKGVRKHMKLKPVSYETETGLASGFMKLKLGSVSVS